jgi:hypothetical protein
MSISTTSNMLFPRIIRWVKWLLIAVSLILAALILGYRYSECVVFFASEHITQDYGLKIEQFKQFEITTSPQLAFSVGQIDLSFDYARFQQKTSLQQKTKSTTAVSNAESPFSSAKILALIPQLRINEMNMQWQNLPDEINLPWSALTVKDIFYSRRITPEFGFTVWQQHSQPQSQQEQKPKQKIAGVNAYYQQQVWQIKLITELATLAPLTSTIFPDTGMTMQGLATANLEYRPANSEQIILQLKLGNAALVSGNQPLIENVSLLLKSELKLTARGWLPAYITFNINQLTPLQLNAESCLQVSQLLQPDVMDCGKLAKITPIEIAPLLPITVNLSLQEGDLALWLVSSEQVNAKVKFLQTRLDLGLSDLHLSENGGRSDWTVGLNGNVNDVSTLNLPVQFKANGHLAMQPQRLALSVSQAKFTAQDLQLAALSSEHLTAELLAPVEIVLTEGMIMPFAFQFATDLTNNVYQKYTVKQFQGNHSGEFMPALVTLTSRWQLDALLLQSIDNLVISDNKLESASGHWQLPEQGLPELLTNVYPLPAGLHLPATTRAELDYNLALISDNPQVTAQLSGKIAADSAQFNDITAGNIATDWGCELHSRSQSKQNSQQNSQPKLALNCQLSAAVAAVDVGAPITDVELSAQLKLDDDKLSVAIGEASAQLFAGSVWVEPLLITDFDHIVGQLRVKDLSLPKMIELYQVPGVTVMGSLQAQLPFMVEGKQVTVINGVIEQQGEGGIIQVRNNATVEQLKLTQPQLKFALDLLEDLDYHYLHSDVDFQPDGQTKFQIHIKGRNPTVERPIEFNYSHDENVLQLFRSLRINDAMYDAIKKMNN